ncbi:serine hydrolase domain-containing protein [Paenarthrobacter sp. NPDC089675]|uniref:serine hydrolase domain-containing protein n=1 Tax=Paenarthrobacter sp. NPDC089675 TaxID=3364376 RepID=UPI003807CA46
MGYGPGRFLLVLMLSTWFLGGCTAGAPGPTPSPAPPGTTEPLERTILHFMEEGATSVVVQVRWPGGEWSKAYGVRDLDTNDPARPQDRYTAASVTQSMVAAEVLKLVDEKRLELDRPVNADLARLVPALKPPGDVTVRELLNHTSGLPDFRDALYRDLPVRDVLEKQLTPGQGLMLAAKLPWQSFNKGFFNYSESNYLALGLLIEDVRGKPLAEVLQQDIFTALGLGRTSLGKQDRQARDNLHGYVTVGASREDVTQAEYLVGSPAGGLVSTTADTNGFYRALLSGRLLPQPLLAEMKNTGLGSHGLGLQRFSISCASGYRFGQTGDVAGYLTSSVNSADGGTQVAMAMALPPMPADTDAAEVAGRVGLYSSQMVSASQETLDKFCPDSSGGRPSTGRE